MTKLVNRAKMTTATTGTGTITLGSAVDGYQTFAAAGVVNGDVVRYVIEDGSAWEIGLGTYTASGTTLARNPSESSNGGAAISLSGQATVFVGAAADDVNNVETAARLATARTISLTGDVTGSVSFNGSANVSITATVVDDSHNHVISNVDGLQTALDGKAATSHTHTSANITDFAEAVKDLLNASGSAPLYAARAWVNFNSTGTVAIRASGNVSSITDNGVGDYTVNFTTAMPDINYATHVQSPNYPGSGGVSLGQEQMTNASTLSRTIAGVRVYTLNGLGVLIDYISTSVAIFR